MCDVQEVMNDLCQTLKRSKDLRREEMVKLLNQVRCCECGHRTRMEKAQDYTGVSSERSSSKISILLWLCIILMLLFIFYLIYVARRYNHMRAYGSGACGSTFFYTFTDCDVFF
ncbi:uncharacterized protein Dwil_GK19375 [Drosophila willistoni]|uniref:Uncharacterized protein n=1 Tax=Drosophila willistoni TaxID=7260 RepID=B4N198_DROWI|nr:uncharacterized protein LOC6644230 [Drosophila willistoni]EDW78091.1 uncharacterized protein Dwil_GK19375 [Drosophila willistoni]